MSRAGRPGANTPSNAAVGRLMSGAGSGAGLPAAVRSEAEGRFGTGFGDVRVHVDDAAARTASTLSAAAFTVGADVYFARGRYAPESPSGRALLAHELTHVVQNRSAAPVSGVVVSDPGDAAEREAERAAGAFVGGAGSVSVAGGAASLVHRQPESGMSVTVPPPTTSPQVRHSAGVLFTDEPEFVRAQLLAYVDAHGLDSLAHFESGLITADAGVINLGMPFASEATPEYIARVTAVLHEQAVTLRADITVFRDDFQRRANDMLISLLAESERRVRDQLTAFGITSNATTAFGFTLWTSYSGADNDQGKQLSAALQPLKAKRPGVVAAKAEFDTVTESNMKSSTPNSAAAEAAQAKFGAAQHDYDAVRGQAETAHPVLQTYNLDPHRLETAGNLEALTSDTGRATALGSELSKELKNIDKVRAAAADNREYIWKLERLVGLTKELPDIAAHQKLPNREVQSLVVAEKSADVKIAQDMIQIGSGIVLGGLGLLAALPTAGASLAGTAAITTAGIAASGLEVALAYQSYQNFALDSAAAATDYERARLLSHDVPELLWLALDILGAGLTVAETVKTAHQLFRKIVQLRKEAIANKLALAGTEPMTAAPGPSFATARTEPAAPWQNPAFAVADTQPMRAIDSPSFAVGKTQPLAAAQPEPFWVPKTQPMRATEPSPFWVNKTQPLAAADPHQAYRAALDDLEAAGNQAKPGAGARLRAEIEAAATTGYQHALSPAEQALQQQRIAGMQPIGDVAEGGVNASFKATLQDGSAGAYKPTSGVSTIAREHLSQQAVTAREVAASRVDEMLQFDLVPTTTFAHGQQGPGSIQKWVSNTTEGLDPEMYKDVLQQQKMAVLDYVIGNTDRHTKNYLTSVKGDLVAIDHGFSFPSPEHPYPIRSEFTKQYLGKDLDPAVVAKVRSVNPEAFRNMLVQTGVDAPSAHAAMQRLQEIQQGGKITKGSTPVIGPSVREFEEWQVRNDPAMQALLIKR